MPAALWIVKVLVRIGCVGLPSATPTVITSRLVGFGQKISIVPDDLVKKSEAEGPLQVGDCLGLLRAIDKP